jgi:dihydroorotate dehydrogenase (NAD+) catalytic subunit
MMAGAWAVQVGTANFFDPTSIVTVAEGVLGFLRAHGLTDPSQLRDLVRLPDEVPAVAGRQA